MINYTLAEKLRDAGFQQSGYGVYIYIPASISPDEYDIQVSKNFALNKNSYYVPTLEQLIEACTFIRFELSTNPGKEWFATSVIGVDSDDASDYSMFTGRGPTPSEAVAHLWLAINTKSDKI